MAVVETEFDGILEEDVILEEVDSAMDAASILKNAENIFKANLYLRELFTSAPVFNEVVKFSTVETTNKETYLFDESSSLIMFKNLRDSESKVFLNGGHMVLLPYESFEFPLVQGMNLEVDGRFSIVETKYK